MLLASFLRPSAALFSTCWAVAMLNRIKEDLRGCLRVWWPLFAMKYDVLHFWKIAPTHRHSTAAGSSRAPKFKFYLLQIGNNILSRRDLHAPLPSECPNACTRSPCNWFCPLGR